MASLITAKANESRKPLHLAQNVAIFLLKKKTTKLSCRGAVDEKVLADAIKMTNVAFNLCLSNKFVHAQAKLEPW